MVVKVSVIIATFNASMTLKGAIDSVLRQNMTDIELIVVDGGSIDGTIDILKSFGSKITAWLSEPDRGIYDAWNKGLSLSTGEWVAFLGADDLLSPDWFVCYDQYLSHNTNVEYVSSSVRLMYPNAPSRVIGQAWSWSVFRRYMNVAHVGSLHHRRLFTKYGLFDDQLKICGDYEFLLRARSTLKAGYLDEILVLMSAGGVSGSSWTSLLETLMVKWKLRSVNRIQAILDFIEAVCKWYFRRFLYFISHKTSNVYFDP